MSSANGVVVEEPLAEEARRQEGAALLGEGFERGFRAGPDRAAPGDDHRTLGLGDQRDDLVDDRRVGRRALRGRDQIARRRVVRRIGEHLVLEIERHAEHDRPALGARQVERLADIVERPSDRANGDKGGAGRQRQRRLVDLLQIPGSGERRIAGKHHQRDVAARRHGQRRHDLGVARSAGHRGDADLAGGAGIAVGHRDGAVLVAGVDQPRPLVVGHRRRPVHVRVAHQGEQHVGALGGEGLGQNVANLVVAHRDCRSPFPAQPDPTMVATRHRAAIVS
ncbi:MAG TPA: hypothetical protein VIM52_17945 [Stellaceae bacterium]